MWRGLCDVVFEVTWEQSDNRGGCDFKHESFALKWAAEERVKELMSKIDCCNMQLYLSC